MTGIAANTGMAKGAAPPSKRYVSAMERLLTVVQELSQAHSVAEVAEITRIAARELTGADGATFVLREEDQCYYFEENAISPLWKGKRFPMDVCISGWAMLNAKPAVIEDIYQDERIPHDAYRPTFVKSLVMVPIRRDAPIGAIGNYWAEKRMPSEEEVAILQALADTTSVALENAELYGDLKAQIAIVQEREARIHAQHETLETFTRALAHDLKEPVRTVNAFAELMTQEGDLPAELSGYFGHIHRASQRMLALIETVFDYMKLDGIQNSALERCNTGDLVSEVIENLHQLIQERKPQISFDGLPEIQGNRVQLIQLLQNLLSNAICHNDTGTQVRVSAARQGRSWLFRVEDNGPIIDKKHVEKIFQPFKRASLHSDGLGIGLAICSRIVEAHGGKIWCEARPGSGNAFLFTIPINAEDDSPKVDNVVEDATVLSGDPSLINLLLVDDMESDLDLTRIIFRRAGIQCNMLTARSGEEALEILENKARDNAPVDLVLLDINMPRMDGFETLEKIKADEAFSRTVTVMCSGSTYEKDRERAASLGAAGYVTKPVEKHVLQTLIDGIPEFNISEMNGRCSIHRATG